MSDLNKSSDTGRNDQQSPQRIPGDNPNKRSASRRKMNRPKVKNQPANSSPQQDTVKWYDPTPVVDPLPAVLEQNIETVPSGEIELNLELPSFIADPFAKAATSVLSRTDLDPAQILNVSEKIEAVAYYKACRQLYSTLTDPQKSCLQPLKAVFYDTSKIPNHMSAALSMIGNMDTKLGLVEIRDAPVLFRRWLISGLNIDPDVPAFDGSVLPSSLVFRDSYSKKLIDRLATNRLKILHDKQFTVKIGNDDVNVSQVMPTINDAGYNSISNIYPDADEMRDLVAITQMTTRDFVKSKAVPHRRVLDDALSHLGLRIVPVGYTDPDLRVAFEEAMESYLTNELIHIQSVFNVGEPPLQQEVIPVRLFNLMA
jgi:hypothetical protein